jgi:uncharacterized protein (TIGR00369 family)
MAALDPELVAQIDAQIVRSPYGKLLGFELVGLAEGRAEVRMPFRPAVTTVGDTVHGGAISALVDTAGTASVWASSSASPQRGATVGFSVNFLAAARSSDLVATATVRRRGRQLSTSEVTVRDKAGREVAVALLTYKFS